MALQWGRSVGAPESSDLAIWSSYSFKLQWGRSVGAPERPVSFPGRVSSLVSFNGAGAWELRKGDFVCDSSVGYHPLQWGRSVGAPERPRSELRNFVQSFASMGPERGSSGKDNVERGDEQTTFVLQWGRSVGAPERVIMSAVIVISVLLQWGRSVGAPERVRGLKCDSGSTCAACFEGSGNLAPGQDCVTWGKL